MARPGDRGRDREDGEGTGWVLDPKVPVGDAPVGDGVAVVLVQRRVEEQVVRVEAVVERAPGEQEGRDAEDNRKQQLAAGGRRRYTTLGSEGLASGLALRGESSRSLVCEWLRGAHDRGLRHDRCRSRFHAP